MAQGSSKRKRHAPKKRHPDFKYDTPTPQAQSKKRNDKPKSTENGIDTISSKGRRRSERLSNCFVPETQEPKQCLDQSSIIIEDDTIPPTQGQTNVTLNLSSLLLTPSRIRPSPRHISDTSSPSDMRTLISNSLYNGMTDTPTQDQVDMVTRELFMARNMIAQMGKEIESLRSEVCAGSVALDLKEQEMLLMREEITKAKRPTDCESISMVEDLKKKICILESENCILESENGSLKSNIEDLKYELTDMTKGQFLPGNGVSTSNKFNILAELNGEETTHRDVSPSRTSIDSSQEILYFRGWWNPLSNFFTHKLTYKDQVFRSAEHCYQYEKAMFHGKSHAADEIRSTERPANAKSLAKRHIPTCDKEWDQISRQVMTDIVAAKARQCKIFHDQLLASKQKLLIHNMENDRKWGFGLNGKGENRMGQILMEVRDKLVSTVCDSTHTQIEQLNSPAVRQNDKAEPKRPSILLIGNSNMRGLAADLVREKVNASAFVFAGRPSREIQSRLVHVKPRDSPTHVLIHTGDIDARRNDRPMSDTIDTLLATQRVFPSATVLVNGISTSVRDPELKRKLINLSHKTKQLCAANQRLVYLDNTLLPLKDGIHYSATSRKSLASSVKDTMLKNCF